MGFRNITFLKPKGGGAHDGGEHCGVYTARLDEQTRTFLAKKEPTLGKNACELAASIIANSFHEYVTKNIRREGEQKNEPADQHRSERFAVVKPIPATLLAASKKTPEKEKKPGQKDTYVASLFASSRSKDFWDFAYEHYLKNHAVFKKLRRRNKHQYLQKPSKRPKFLGTGEPKTVFDTVMGKIIEINPHFLQEFSDVRVVNFIIQNFDNHIGNLVISHEQCGQCDACLSGKGCSLPPLENVHVHSIDFAGAFDPAYKKFNDYVSPVRKGPHNPQPTNHNDEYSRKWKITPEMITACKDYISAIQAIGSETSRNVAREIVANFDLPEIEAYVVRLMEVHPRKKRREFSVQLRQCTDDQSKKQFFHDTIISCLDDNFFNRAIPQCEQEMFEIQLSLCFEPKKSTRPELGFKLNREKLLSFFNIVGTSIIVESQIREMKFRLIGQEDYLSELQKITLNFLTEVRMSQPSLQEENEASLYEQNKKKIVLNILSGKKPESSLLLNKHGVFRKREIKTHAPVSFKKRLRNAVLDIYDLSPTSSLWSRIRKVIGWLPAGRMKWLPRRIRKYIAKPFYFIFMLPRSLLKIALELIPEAGAQLFGWLRDYSLYYLKNKDNRVFQNPVTMIKHVGAALLFVVGSVLSPTCKIARQIGMRITSPVRSTKEAYRFGKMMGNRLGKPVGYFVGALAALTSMAVSAVGILATTTVMTPVVVSGLSAIGLSSASTWIAGVAITLSDKVPGISTITQFIGASGLATSALSTVSAAVLSVAAFGKGAWQKAKKLIRKMRDKEFDSEVSISMSQIRSTSTTARFPFRLQSNAYEAPLEADVDSTINAARKINRVNTPTPTRLTPGLSLTPPTR
jgi:hypothetical protein